MIMLLQTLAIIGVIAYALYISNDEAVDLRHKVPSMGDRVHWAGMLAISSLMMSAITGFGFWELLGLYLMSIGIFSANFRMQRNRLNRKAPHYVDDYTFYGRMFLPDGDKSSPVIGAYLLRLEAVMIGMGLLMYVI